MNMSSQTFLTIVLAFSHLAYSEAFSASSMSLSKSKMASALFASTLTQEAMDQYTSMTPNDIYQVPESPFSPDPFIEEQRLDVLSQEPSPTSSFDYGSFAKEFPLVNNMLIASTKAAVADLFAQTVIGQAGLGMVDWERTFLFCLFGAFYQGGFQYLYQVNVFSKLFDVEKFTSQPWTEKLRDGPGLRSLAIQVALDLAIMSSIYLPTYYTFKASIFSGVMDPSVWVHDGISSYGSHFCRDETDLLKVWLPADLFCFSAPLILRLPLRQVISLFYTAYLSAASFGGN